MKPLLTRRIFFESWQTIVALAAILYTVLLTNTEVGYFVDDATYILGAQSLLSGRYSALFHPAQPPLTQFPPGYSFFLVPFVKCFAPHWFMLEIPSMLLTLGSIYLAWKLFEGWLTPLTRWFVCLLFAFNQVTLTFQNAVLSEPLFIFSSLISLILLKRILKQPVSLWITWILVIALSTLPLIRFVGFALIPSAAISLIYARRKSTAGRVLFFSFLPIGTWWLHNRTLSAPGTVQMDLFRTMTSHLWSAYGLNGFDHLHRTIHMFFIYGAAQLRLPHQGIGITLSIVVSLLLIGLFSLGFRSLFQKNKPERALALGLCLYIWSFIGMHVLWAAIDPRFVFPILIFLLAFLVEGLRVLCTKRNFLRSVGIFVSALGLTIYLYRTAEAAWRWNIWQKEPVYSVPQMTFTWIQRTVPIHERILCARSSTLYLYTGHQGVNRLNAPTPQEFRDRLIRYGFTHILLEDASEIGVAGLLSDNILLNQVRSWPAAFHKTYENPKEHTVIYRIVKP